jgi:hypothetical protein
MEKTADSSQEIKNLILECSFEDLDVVSVCRACSEDSDPPDAFLITANRAVNRLLGMRLGFLELGQSLPCPGLPLAGAAFDPCWGFAEAAVERHRDGSASFLTPVNRFDLGEHGDTYGYRLCSLERLEVPEVVAELVRIRGELERIGRAREQASIATVTRV